MCTLRMLIYLCIIKTSYLQTNERPHIVLIIADDMGWNDASFHGSDQIPTPNIDALAYNGMILNRFYTLPICTPTRAALLTGQYPMRFDMQGDPLTAGENRHLPFTVPTLPEKLKELSYSTNLIGKWHLGYAYKNVTPTGRGFDYHFGYWNGYIGYFDHNAVSNIGQLMEGLDMHHNYEPMWETQGQYVTKLFTQKAEEVISNHDQTKPLFLTVSHLAPHAGKPGTNGKLPDVAKNDEKFSYITDNNRRLYAGIVSELDKSVGRIVESLSANKMLDNTLILFISDNGAQTTGRHENYGSNWPLRGMKMSIMEGGVRNIGIAYSSRMKGKKTVSQELIHVTDLMPTFYAAAGGKIEDLNKIDGINQLPTLLFNKKSSRSEMLVNIDKSAKVAALIGENGRFKLVNGSAMFEDYDNYYGDDGRNQLINPIYNTMDVLNSKTNIALGGNLTHEDILQIRIQAQLKDNCRMLSKAYESCIPDKLCLFDLFEDPCETTNISEDYPEIVEKLASTLLEYSKASIPQKAKYIDPKSNPIYFNNSWYTWLDT